MRQFNLLVALAFVALALATGNVFFLAGTILFLYRAGRDAQIVRAEIMLENEPVEEAMMAVFLTLSPGDSLRRASAALVKAPSQRQYPVMQGETLVGVLTRETLLTAMNVRGGAVYVSEIMERRIETVEATEKLRHVLARFPDLRRTPALVLQQGKLAGILTADSVTLYLTLRSITRRERIGRGRI